MKKPNIVCIGGGTGQAEILRGLKTHDCNITAIVAVTDSGRSTGAIRRSFDILAPGDLRNCIVALSESEDLLKEIFQHRFGQSKDLDLEGMSLGNLFITAMIQVKGDVYQAIKETSRILKIRGTVLPSITQSTHICAELEDGKVVKEEFNVRSLGKAPIRRIYLEKQSSSPKEVTKAINTADLIIIGPGSLYTSVLVHFLVPNLKKAVKESRAKKIFMVNMITQAGQTDGFGLSKHISEAEKYIGEGIIDQYVFNTRTPPQRLIKEYEKEGGFLVKDDSSMLAERLKEKILKVDILKEEDMKKEEWKKVVSARHDPDKTSAIIKSFLKTEKDLRAVILAAGSGTRMMPFSLSESKTMIHFLGRPILAYHVDECLINGIEDITIVCSENNKTEISGYFRDKYDRPIDTKKPKLHFTVQKEQKGPSHAIMTAEKHLMGSFFLLKYGDSISSEDETKGIIKAFSLDKDVDCVTTLREVDSPEEYGIARFKGDKIVEIIEKPKSNAPSNLANVGLAIIDSDKYFASARKQGFESVIIPQENVLREGGISSYWITRARRLDVGRAWNILEVNKLLIDRFGAKKLSGNIARSAKIGDRCFIGEGAIIGEDVIIEGYCSVEGYIGKGTRIIDSVIMQGTKIGKNCVIEASVIGRDNVIEDDVKISAGESSDMFSDEASKKGKEKGDIKDTSSIKMYVKGRYVNPSIKKAGLFTGKNVTIMEGVRSMPGKMVFPNKIVKEDIKEDKLIRAILFDADNTLYSTKRAGAKADESAMIVFSQATGIDKEEIISRWRRIVDKVKDSSDPNKRTRKYSYGILSKEIGTGIKITKKAHDEFVKTLIEKLEPEEGMIEAIMALKGYKLAIFTEDTSEITLPKLKKFGLEKRFELIVTSDKIGEMKPTRKYYEEVFKKFNVIPGECVVVGDDYDKDLKIAKDLGASVIIYGKEDKRADYSVMELHEIPSLLQEM